MFLVGWRWRYRPAKRGRFPTPAVSRTAGAAPATSFIRASFRHLTCSGSTWPHGVTDTEIRGALIDKRPLTIRRCDSVMSVQSGAIFPDRT
jgi:hypothetical protein